MYIARSDMRVSVCMYVCMCVHNANMFFQQTSTAWMIDYIITPLIVSTEWIMGAVRRSSRHPEYHYFRKNCNLKNRITRSFVTRFVVEIYDFFFMPVEQNLRYGMKSFRDEVVPFGVSPRITKLKWHIVFLERFTVFRIPTYFSHGLFFRK